MTIENTVRELLEERKGKYDLVLQKRGMSYVVKSVGGEAEGRIEVGEKISDSELDDLMDMGLNVKVR